MTAQPRRARRIDATQPLIVERLRAIGAWVKVIADPFDLLVAYHGRWYVLEVKSPGGRLTSGQERDIESLGDCATVHIVYSFDEALAVLRGTDKLAKNATTR